MLCPLLKSQPRQAQEKFCWQEVGRPVPPTRGLGVPAPPPWERLVGEGQPGRGGREPHAVGACAPAAAPAQTLRPPGPCWISMINAAVVT